MGLFGGGNSSSNTTSTTNNYDKRVIGGDDSTNISADLSGVGASLNITDGGAVKAATDLVQRTVAQSYESSGQLFSGAITAVKDANKQLAQAYQQGNAGDQTQLKYAGFIVVALAAAMVFKNLKA